MRVWSVPFAGQTLALYRTLNFEFREGVYAAGLRIPRHAHDLAYLGITLDGSHEQTSPGGVRRCLPGSVGFHPRGESHSDSFADCPTRMLSVKLLRPEIEDLGAPGRIVSAPREGDPRGGWLVRRIRAEMRRPDEVSLVSLEGLAWQLLGEVLRWRNGCGSGATPRWLRQVRETIGDRFAEPVSLQSIAAGVGVHPAHLAREYRRHYGRTVGEEIRRRRLEWSCEEMGKGKLSLAEIALEAGFAEQSSFSRFFRKRMGMPPAEYRRQLREC